MNHQSSHLICLTIYHYTVHTTKTKKFTDHCLQKKKEVETKVTSLDSDSGAEEGDGQCSQTSVHTLDLNEAPGTILSIFGILFSVYYCISIGYV